MKVLLLSTEASDRTKISEWLTSRGYEVRTARTAAAAAMDALPSAAPPFALVDLASRAESLRFLRGLITAERTVWSIAIADRRDAGSISEALRLGVIDVVRRPLRESDLMAALANAREFAGLAARRDHPAPEPPPGTVFTGSPRMREIYEVARRIAPSRCPVLLVGERGTGRETVAHAIHQHSPLRDAEFVRATCGGLDAADLRSLFSREEAFVFLESAGELTPQLQSKLEDWVVSDTSRDHREGQRGIRLVVATRPRIDTLVAHGDFRRSLYDALAIVRIDMPLLRERPQDIPVLAIHFLKEACARYDLTPKTFSRSALTLLSSLPWRGNAAELRGLIDRLAVLIPRGVVLQEDVLQHLRFDDVQARGAAGGTLREARHQFEREFIASALQRHQWRMEAAASELGIERTNLYRKMKQLSIIRGDGRN
jgi:DNA-binding NtrC family response regulator